MCTLLNGSQESDKICEGLPGITTLIILVNTSRPEKTSPTFYRRYFGMYFLNRKSLYFDWNFTEFCIPGIYSTVGQHRFIKWLCCQAGGHYLNQCWPSSMMPYGVTRPQWVNLSLVHSSEYSRGHSLCYNVVHGNGTDCISLLYMGQVTKLWLSCYLVLLSIDSKTR